MSGLLCRIRTRHYTRQFAEWWAKYNIHPTLPHVPTLKARVNGIETKRCTWCYTRCW